VKGNGVCAPLGGKLKSGTEKKLKNGTWARTGKKKRPKKFDLWDLGIYTRKRFFQKKGNRRGNLPQKDGRGSLRGRFGGLLNLPREKEGWKRGNGGRCRAERTPEPAPGSKKRA